MGLKLGHLQKVVKNAVNEERAVTVLRNEVTRVLGPIIDTDVRLERLAESVNERLEVLERTGRASAVRFKTSVIAKFANHKDPEVRKMVVRLLPERFLAKYVADKSPGVRSIIAKKGSLKLVQELARRHPGDHNVRSIYKERLILAEEAMGDLPDQDGFKDDPAAYQVLGTDAARSARKQLDYPDLSDEWYAATANSLLRRHGDGQIEFAWEEAAVNNLIAHTKATSGVVIDRDKLVKALDDQIKDEDDRSLERNALKEIASRLKADHAREIMETTAVLPIIEENEDDPVKDLVESNIGPAEYVERAMQVFRIQEATLPKALRKFRLSEGLTESITVPMKGRMPHLNDIRPLDEQALDRFVRMWSNIQAAAGEPFKLNWHVDPGSVNAVGFTLELK